MIKLSVITPTLNASKTIIDCIKSVETQSYKNVEHIIFDGGSSDGTVEKIQKFKSNKVKLIRGKDCGLYNALNQASKKATGDWLTILNGDDYLTNIYICELVIEKIKSNPEISLLYGDVCSINPISTRVNRYWKSSSYSEGEFQKGWSPPHPGFFYKKTILNDTFGYNESMKIAADIEFMYRLLEINRYKSYYISTPLVQMRSGGLSGGLSSKILLNLEIISFLKSSASDFNLFKFIINKLFFKGMQYFKSGI